MSSAFYFMNVTLNQHLENRLSLKILIDVGEPEQNPVDQVRIIRVFICAKLKLQEIAKDN